MKLKKILYVALMGFGLASCANEAPFTQETKREGEGKFLAHSLKVEVKSDETLVRASSGVPDVGDFTVVFINTENNKGEIEQTYQYSALPEVVTLPVGSYVVKAYYGGDLTKPSKAAAFSAPYYLGESEVFQIENNKIIDDLEPVVCKLANVKVTINFDTLLVQQMSSDSKVSVTVGNSSSLEFFPSTTESGYFAYVEGSCTLAASFSGSVEGDYTTETKTYSDVKPGTHYNITFKLHSIDPNEPGDVNLGNEGEEIKVDAVVNLEDMTGEGGMDITPDQEYYLEDDRYPKDDPNTPVGPDDPQPADGPSITAGAGIDLDNVNEVKDGMECKLLVISTTGITAFDVDIISEKLTSEELEGVGLAAHMDLVNPGSLEEPLSGLGFPVNVGGEKSVEFNITGFLPMLGALGAAEHTFKLTVSDETGTTEKELKLKTN